MCKNRAAIKSLYPIGLLRDAPGYAKHAGIKKIVQVIEDSMRRQHCNNLIRNRDGSGYRPCG
jgi:hypothetical protein